MYWSHMESMKHCLSDVYKDDNDNVPMKECVYIYILHLCI